MPSTINGPWPELTSTNIGYGEAIASSATRARKRVAPIFSDSQAASGCTQNWMIATKNRHSRISERSKCSCWVV
ncbi:hypothetical protein D3C80_1725110 [compost metagenome]